MFGTTALGVGAVAVSAPVSEEIEDAKKRRGPTPAALLSLSPTGSCLGAGGNLFKIRMNQWFHDDVDGGPSTRSSNKLFWDSLKLLQLSSRVRDGGGGGGCCGLMWGSGDMNRIQ